MCDGSFYSIVRTGYSRVDLMKLLKKKNATKHSTAARDLNASEEPPSTSRAAAAAPHNDDAWKTVDPSSFRYRPGTQDGIWESEITPRGRKLRQVLMSFPRNGFVGDHIERRKVPKKRYPF